MAAAAADPISFCSAHPRAQESSSIYEGPENTQKLRVEGNVYEKHRGCKINAREKFRALPKVYLGVSLPRLRFLRSWRAQLTSLPHAERNERSGGPAHSKNTSLAHTEEARRRPCESLFPPFTSPRPAGVLSPNFVLVFRYRNTICASPHQFALP